MHFKDPRRTYLHYTPACRALAALLWSIAPAFLSSQQLPTIRVPARLVSVPALVLGADGRTLLNLRPADFRVFDGDRPQTFTVDTSVTPLSVVIAVQANSHIRDYLPFIAKVGSALDALLVGDAGECAVLVYGDEVTLAKPFESGDLATTLRRLTSGGTHSRTIDAGVRALAMLRQRPRSRTRLLLFIGQPADDGSDYLMDDVRRDAESDNVTIDALALPEAGKSFISDTFSLRGLSSSNILERGGFEASADLSRLIPALTRSAAAAANADPLSVLTAATGGTLLHFRKQAQLEDAISIVGVELRSVYALSFPPRASPVITRCASKAPSPGRKFTRAPATG